MSENNEIRIPPVDPPIVPPPMDQEKGCLDTAVKIIAILMLGIFVLGGLVFASCFLAIRR